MPEETINITLQDAREEGTQKFANLVDPLNLSTFISRVKDPHEKRTLDELVRDLLDGR